MIQIKNVVDALYNAIGWRDDISDDITLSDAVKVSLSGLYYNDAHPLLTLKNLASIAPDFANHVWPTYSAVERYSTGDYVKVDDTIYRCYVDSTIGIMPGSTPDWETNWEIFTPFEAWLETKTRASIANAINHFIFSVMPSGGTKSVLEHRLLFNGVTRINGRCDQYDRYVGLEIHPIHSYDTVAKLEKVSLQAINTNAAATTDLARVYLRSSNSMLDLLDNQDVTIGKANGVNTILKNAEIRNYDGGQALYLYYDQNELINKHFEAINRTVDWSKAPCSACNSADYISYLAWSKYLEIWPFFVAKNHLIDANDGTYTFDQQDLVYVNNTNWGLNLELSLFCDYTNFIIRHKAEFYPLLMKQMAVDMLKEFAYNANVRANRNSVNASRADIIMQLEGSQSQQRQGLYSELETMYKGLNISMKGLDAVCRPCANHGLRYTVT